MFRLSVFVVFFSVFSCVESSLWKNGIVFTGKVLNISQDTRSISVQIVKNLLMRNNVKVDAVVTLQDSDDGVINLNELTKRLFIFFTLPLEDNIFELLHYWIVKHHDFLNVPPGNFEGIWHVCVFYHVYC